MPQKSSARGLTSLAVFLALGAGVFVFDGWIGGGESAGRIIEIDQQQLASIRERWSAQWDRPPTSEELAGLVDDAVREEVLYREALRLGLDRDDTIVRRRLAQKMTFMLEDGMMADAPDDTEIAAYHSAHADRYREPRRTTFAHIYLSDDRRPDAQSDAIQLLGELSAAGGDAWRRLGDPFMLLREYANRTDQEIGELFGSQFAEALGDADQGVWSGPLRSAYGLHLVRVVTRSESRALALDEVRDRVVQDLATDRRRDLNRSAFDELRSRYDVLVPGLSAGDR